MMMKEFKHSNFVFTQIAPIPSNAMVARITACHYGSSGWFAYWTLYKAV